MTLQSSVPVAYVYVTDRDRALAFYREQLGLPLKSSDDQGDFFEIGNGLLRMTPAGDFQPGPHPVLGFEVADIETNVASLSDRGVAFTQLGGEKEAPAYIWSSPDASIKVAFFTDPDGNALTLSQT